LRLLLLGAQGSGQAAGPAPDALHLQLLKRRGPPLTESLVVQPQSQSQTHHGALDRFAA
jgi:hypothetical protein